MTDPIMTDQQEREAMAALPVEDQLALLVMENQRRSAEIGHLLRIVDQLVTLIGRNV